MWQLSMTLPRYLALDLGQKIENAEIALSVSCFEKDERNLIWSLEALYEEKPFDFQIQDLIPEANQSEIAWEVKPLEEKNWLEENRKSFPPIDVGSFYIHGAHVTDVPEGKTSILLDASTAFGSGEHFTTKGCLQAIEDLCASHKFKKPMDMGCGTGILAFATANLTKKKVLATDIDPEAVEKTLYNAKANGLSQLVEVRKSVGWREVQETGFDLIAANILAGRLCELAPQMKAHMASGGFIVLSGLLESQKQMVIGAYVVEGFKFHKEFLLNEWSTLVMQLG